MNETRKDIVDLYQRLKKIDHHPFDSKRQMIEVLLESCRKAIEIESRELKPDEKVIVNIDADNPEGFKIHAKKIKK